MGGAAVNENYHGRGVIDLDRGVAFDRPPRPPELVHLDSPALEVFTDFRVVCPETVGPEVPIDQALEQMKRAGVRLLLVTEHSTEQERVIGLVTADDLQGEKPVKLVEDSRMGREAITVRQVMTPQSQVRVLDMRSARDAQVGHVVATLRALERKHLLVVELDGHRQRIRGLFSATQIRRQLGLDSWEEIRLPHSLAEMVHEAG